MQGPHTRGKTGENAFAIAAKCDPAAVESIEFCPIAAALGIVECKQAGIFEARNIPPEQLDPLLGIGCPNIVYPYLRANIADLITRAGFPPVHLSEINFEVFYQQRLQALAQQQGELGQAGGSGIVMPDGSQATH